MTLRLGTRGSTLAMAQSRMFAEALSAATGEPVDLVEITTDGDRSSAPVQHLGVGVFVSALRDALHAKEIDFAVHSYKDLPTAAADGLAIAAVPAREDPRDALVTASGAGLTDLPEGARIGTGSPRRVAQLHALGRGFECVPLRGNVDTRLRKLAAGGAGRRRARGGRDPPPRPGRGDHRGARPDAHAAGAGPGRAGRRMPRI